MSTSHITRLTIAATAALLAAAPAALAHDETYIGQSVEVQSCYLWIGDVFPTHADVTFYKEDNTLEGLQRTATLTTDVDGDGEYDPEDGDILTPADSKIPPAEAANC